MFRTQFVGKNEVHFVTIKFHELNTHRRLTADSPELSLCAYIL